jgi:putative transposase
MPRGARVVLPGYPHHVTQRGNDRQDVFFTDQDRLNYLRILGVQSRKYGVAVHGYCLMTNHVHLVLVPSTADGLARGVGRTHFVYTQYLNKARGRSGHLWQNRFYSCPVGQDYMLGILCYTEQNPARAGLVSLPWEYQWSSASAHIKRRTSSGLLDLSLWGRLTSPERWRQLLLTGPADREVQEARRCTRLGHPMISDEELTRIEAATGRRLRPRPVGRPRRRTRN